MQKDNQDFESVWKNYNDPNYSTWVDKRFAEHFYNAGVASTKRKPEQIPALFKPKESK